MNNLNNATLSSQMALLAIALAVPDPVQSAETASVSQHDLQAKLEYCKTCHGLSAEGFRGAGATMPRLAGQQKEYLESQLMAFISGKRKNKYMSNVARVLRQEMCTALAKHFEDLNPKPIGATGASNEMVDAGKKIYEDGIPESNIQPCSLCHGANAEGGAGPRLAGQLDEYTFKTLTHWSDERDASAIMAPIARSLNEMQISAVAAYVSGLEPSSVQMAKQRRR